MGEQPPADKIRCQHIDRIKSRVQGRYRTGCIKQEKRSDRARAATHPSSRLHFRKGSGRRSSSAPATSNRPMRYESSTLNRNSARRIVTPSATQISLPPLYLISSITSYQRDNRPVYQIAYQSEKDQLHADVTQQGKRRHHPVRQVKNQFVHRVGEGLYKPVQEGRNDIYEVESHKRLTVTE